MMQFPGKWDQLCALHPANPGAELSPSEPAPARSRASVTATLLPGRSFRILTAQPKKPKAEKRLEDGASQVGDVKCRMFCCLFFLGGQAQNLEDGESHVGVV